MVQSFSTDHKIFFLIYIPASSCLYLIIKSIILINIYIKYKYMDIYMYKFVYTHFLNKCFYHHLFEKYVNIKSMLITTHVYKYIL